MSTNNEQNLSDLKDSLVDIILITGTILGTLVFIISMIPYDSSLINSDSIVDFTAILFLYLTYIFRKKYSVKIKVSFVILIAYGIFLSDLIDAGLYTQDFIIIAVIPFLSILIFNLRITISLYTFCMATVLVVGYLFYEGIITSTFHDYSEVNYLRWVETVLMNSVVIFIITLFLYRFDKKIYSLFQDLQSKNDHLTEREFLLSTIIDSFPRSYMSVIDSDYIIRMTGGSEFKTLGIDPNDYNDKSVMEVFSPFGDELLNTIMDAYKKTLDGEGQVFEIKLGNQYQMYKTMPLADKNKKVKSFLSVVENITESVESKKLIEDNLNEKNILLQEIHHRVKNNLAVVSGLLTLQSLKISDDKTKFILDKSTNRIMSIAKVHEMLYESKNFNKIPFKRYINELTTIILDSMNNDGKLINFETNILIDYISINHGVPLGIIFNELITNSVKYGFDGNFENKIQITVSQNNDRFEVVYEDNGCGIEDFEFASSKSLGFTLIQSLMQQIEAEFEYDTTNKFKLNFSFPANYENDSVKFKA